jgi:site-specific DNA-methyltransferase (adenine-specific)
MTWEREVIGDCTLYRGDCRDVLPTLDAASLDMIITSPPYNCGKAYGLMHDLLPSEAFWSFTQDWVTACYRLIQTGGRLAVNLPWWMGKKPRREVPFFFQTLATECGWLFLDKILWVKGNGENYHISGGYGGGGSGWGTWCSPSGPVIRCVTEPILLFAKETRGRRRISGHGLGACVKGDMSEAEFLAWTVDVWMIQGSYDKEHPAVFPAEIPRRLLKLYTYAGESILDPFAGSFTSGMACVQLGRSFIGIEIERRFFDLGCRRIEDAYRQLSLFPPREALPKPQQLGLGITP